MSVIRSKFLRYAIGAVVTSAAITTCVGAVLIYRLPTVSSLLRSNADEVSGKKFTFPGEHGFWIAFPSHPNGFGYLNGDAEITWVARKGFMPTRCEQRPSFNYCWGNKLSTIEGGDWSVDRHRFKMIGRLYFHYKPVPPGIPGSVIVGKQPFIKDAATCAGDYQLSH